MYLQKHRRKAQHTTRKAPVISEIPFRTGPWENPEPGYGEIDTVVHCGMRLEGDMAYTVNFTDIITTWFSVAAQMNKGQQATVKSIESIEKRLPFALLGLDSDGGSEFINWVLKALNYETLFQRQGLLV